MRPQLQSITDLMLGVIRRLARRRTHEICSVESECFPMNVLILHQPWSGIIHLVVPNISSLDCSQLAQQAHDFRRMPSLPKHSLSLVTGYWIQEMRDQLRWNSSTANSPDSALVYRATIAPLDHPAAARTDVSDTPLRSACTCPSATPRVR